MTMLLLSSLCLFDAYLLSVDKLVIQSLNGGLGGAWFLHLNEAKTFRGARHLIHDQVAFSNRAKFLK
jgi:hypothetical protein